MSFFFIRVLGSVYSYSLVMFIIFFNLLLGFWIWVVGLVYFCLDFVVSLVGVGTIEFIYL